MLFGFEFIFLRSGSIFLPVCKNNNIHCTTFILTFNDAENIPLSKNIIIVRVSFTHVPQAILGMLRIYNFCYCL